MTLGPQMGMEKTFKEVETGEKEIERMNEREMEFKQI